MSLNNIYEKSTLFIVNNVENSLNEIVKTLPKHSIRIIKNEEEGKNEFLLLQAQKAIKEAYIASSEPKYILLCGDSFRVEAQNAILKILEEPPKNIEFIIISATKSNLLPTVRSRLPILKNNHNHEVVEVDINLARVDYAQVFAFLKEHSRIGKLEAKHLLEALYNRATITDMLVLSTAQLDNFDKAYRLLDLNSRPQSVLAMLVMSFVQER